MIFERKYYLTQLIHGIGNGMVKIVTGIRRCGKSFLLFNIFRNYLLQNGVAEDHIIGLSLDDFRNSKLRDPQKLLDYIDNHYHNDGKTNEVDFVVNNGSQRYYIQSAYAMPTPEKEQQELRSLINIDDSFKKIIVVYEDILPHRNNNGVLTLGLRQFLLDRQSIEI